MSEQLYRKVYTTLDAGDYEWIYDPQRCKVYLVDAEEEMGEDNGYWVASFQGATRQMNQENMPENWYWTDKYIEAYMKELQYFVYHRGSNCENCGVFYSWNNMPERHHCLVKRSKSKPELDNEINIELVCKRCHDSGIVNSQQHAREFASRQIARGYKVATWYRSLPLKIKEQWILELEE